MEKIESFKGQYSFLSNLYDSPFNYRYTIGTKGEDIDKVKRLQEELYDIIFIEDKKLPEIFLKCKTVEHGFCALKSEYFIDVVNILDSDAPNEAKRKSENTSSVPSWEFIKEAFMYDLVREKFSQNPKLLDKLIQTEGKKLIHGNWWKDFYWGVDSITGEGKNRLGEILMRFRTNFLLFHTRKREQV